MLVFILAPFLVVTDRATARGNKSHPGADASLNETDPNGTVLAKAADWKMEKIILKKGRPRRGVIVSESSTLVDFAQIEQRQGKGMYVVIRPVAKSDIKSIERLSSIDRTELLQRLSRFRNRTRIESGRIEDIKLQKGEVDNLPTLRYKGSWFELDSTADEEMTRLCIVRVEQIFLAYRQILPPRTEPDRPLHLLLFGSSTDYDNYLAKRRMQINNPALFLPRDNLVVVSGDLNKISAQLKILKNKIARLRADLRKREADVRKEIADDILRRQEKGFSKEQIAKWLRLKNANVEAGFSSRKKDITTVERGLDTLIKKTTSKMFRRLYHEAFHAYLENYVFPHSKYDVPLWLNEGMAQIFENGQLDVDTLRIDTPDASLLKNLQEDLQGTNPMTLGQLVTAGPDVFISRGHDDETTNRYYQYAWGAAYYLVFYKDILSGERLRQFVCKRSPKETRIDRFEQFVGQRIPQFQVRWQEVIVGLKAED